MRGVQCECGKVFDRPCPVHGTHAFDPDWVVHPGATLAEWMVEHDASVHSVAAAGGLEPHTVAMIVGGMQPLHPTMCEALERATAIPARMWANMEAAFRKGMAEGKTWTR